MSYGASLSFGYTYSIEGFHSNETPASAVRHSSGALRRPKRPGMSAQSGSANANSALPWEEPSILGRNPSAQPPQPLGATMYCLPSTL